MHRDSATSGVREPDRRDYLGALAEADHGRLGGLATLFARLQQEAVVKALGLSQQILEDRIREALVERARAVESAAGELAELTRRRLTEIADQVGRMVGSAGNHAFEARVFRSDEENEHWFGSAIWETAKALGYTPNLARRRLWVHLRIRHTFTASFVVSFHHVGSSETDLMVGTAFLTIRENRPLSEPAESDITLADPGRAGLRPELRHHARTGSRGDDQGLPALAGDRADDRARGLAAAALIASLRIACQLAARTRRPRAEHISPVTTTGPAAPSLRSSLRDSGRGTQEHRRRSP